MIEKTIIDYLTTALNVPCYVMVPETLPTGGFIVLDRIGTEKTDYVTSYEMAISSYGDTALDAAELNEEVITAMENMIDLDTISKSKLVNSQMNTDIVRKMPRYQCTFDIVIL